MKLKEELSHPSRFTKGVVLIIFGMILILTPEGFLSSKGIGAFLILFSVLWMWKEISLLVQIKKSKNSHQINEAGHKIIARYFEKNNITYIYKPRNEKMFEFLLPQYDIYVKYWKEHSNKMDREKVLKHAQADEMRVVELYYNKIEPMQFLHSSFMKKLSMQLIKR